MEELVCCWRVTVVPKGMPRILMVSVGLRTRMPFGREVNVFAGFAETATHLAGWSFAPEPVQKEETAEKREAAWAAERATKVDSSA